MRLEGFSALEFPPRRAPRSLKVATATRRGELNSNPRNPRYRWLFTHSCTTQPTLASDNGEQLAGTSCSVCQAG
jgi:hypothetical protein